MSNIFIIADLSVDIAAPQSSISRNDYKKATTELDFATFSNVCETAIASSVFYSQSARAAFRAVSRSSSFPSEP